MERLRLFKEWVRQSIANAIGLTDEIDDLRGEYAELWKEYEEIQEKLLESISDVENLTEKNSELSLALMTAKKNQLQYTKEVKQILRRKNLEIALLKRSKKSLKDS